MPSLLPSSLDRTKAQSGLPIPKVCAFPVKGASHGVPQLFFLFLCPVHLQALGLTSSSQHSPG